MYKLKQVIEKIKEYEDNNCFELKTSVVLHWLNEIQNEAINYSRCCKSDSELLCGCGGNERIALDCTMKPCKHPKYYNK